MTSFIPDGKFPYAVAVETPKVGFSHYSAELARWRDRSRQRRELRNLDDRMLDDIGITRAQALAEAQKPWWRA